MGTVLVPLRQFACVECSFLLSWRCTILMQHMQTHHGIFSYSYHSPSKTLQQEKIDRESRIRKFPSKAPKLFITILIRAARHYKEERDQNLKKNKYNKHNQTNVRNITYQWLKNGQKPQLNSRVLLLVSMEGGSLFHSNGAFSKKVVKHAFVRQKGMLTFVAIGSWREGL